MLHNCDVSVNSRFLGAWGVAENPLPEAFASEVVRLLRQAREERGLSKYQVAMRCGLSQQSISYAERKLRHPSFETVFKLAQGVGVRLEDVVAEARKNLSGWAGGGPG